MEHIPGATLIPLDQLMEDVTRVPTDRRAGGFIAATACGPGLSSEWCADSGIFAHPIYSLVGGISAWEEGLVSDFPKLGVFDEALSGDALANVAMNLEKGAFRFYQFLIEKFEGRSIVQNLESISAMESAHARLIYNLFPRDERSTESFQDVFGNLSGEIIEGGQALKDVLRGP